VETEDGLRQHCVVCGTSLRGFEGVFFDEDEHCLPCFNRKVARQMGITFDQVDLQPVALSDVDGQRHTFHVQSRLAPTGLVVEAFEVADGVPRGYRFSILGDFEADAIALFSDLYERMRQALSVKQVQRGEFGWSIEFDQTVSGRITSDLDGGDRLPVVVIDGREFSWEELGQILMSYEGFTLDLRVRDSIEVVGGPLLDDE
jgi:hypothetical protein